MTAAEVTRFAPNDGGELVGGPAERRFAGNREGQAEGNHRGDTDHLSMCVEHRATRIAWRHLHVQQQPRQSPRQDVGNQLDRRLPYRVHDAGGECADQAERMADGEDQHTRPQSSGAAQ
jgi:hypothetical protein